MLRVKEVLFLLSIIGGLALFVFKSAVKVYERRINDSEYLFQTGTASYRFSTVSKRE